MNQNNYKHKRKFFAIVPVIILFGLTGIVMWLWNACLVGAVVGISVISYWQAMGLLVLSKIFFGCFPGKGRKGGRPFGNSACNRPGENLSDEEKEQFKSMWRERFDQKFDNEK